MDNSAARHALDRTLKADRPADSLAQRWLRRLVLRQLDGLEEGELEVLDRDRRWRFGRATPDFAVRARLVIEDPRAYEHVALGGDIGAAEAFAARLWSTDDLTGLVRLMVRNRHVADGLERWTRSLAGPLRRIRHWGRRNTRDGSLRNIRAHYDLGNDYFARFLDPSMTYSCGVFESDATSLEEASIRKHELICRRLDLGPTDRVLEIGGGWGSFALHAARRFGCHVVTTTISHAQYEWSRRRVAAAGLADRVTVLNADYRDLPTRLRRRFDKLVSVEMIEAVGEKFLKQYLRTCSALLAPHGTMLIQAILIVDRLFAEYAQAVDFIQRHIFPGGFLPSVGVITRHLSDTDLQLALFHDITPHYPRTLRAWRRRLLDARDELLQSGYSDWLVRMWEYYFSYCEGGFLEGQIRTAQLLLQKPRSPLHLLERQLPCAAPALAAAGGTVVDLRQGEWTGRPSTAPGHRREASSVE